MATVTKRQNRRSSFRNQFLDIYSYDPLIRYFLKIFNDQNLYFCTRKDGSPESLLKGGSVWAQGATSPKGH
jgi:hypothetical protein